MSYFYQSNYDHDNLINDILLIVLLAHRIFREEHQVDLFGVIIT